MVAGTIKSLMYLFPRQCLPVSKLTTNQILWVDGTTE